MIKTFGIYILLFGLFQSLVFAQQNIQQIQIGDEIPEELWELPLQVVNHPEGKETITLADYKDKLIILDFWATWCAPCITSLYKLDTLQKEFAENLMVVPITPETAEKITPFIEKKGWYLPSVTNDNDITFTTLKDYFPFRAVPYQVWIKDNKLLATTSGNESTKSNIQDVINSGSSESLVIRKDNLTYDLKRPLLFDGNGGDLNDLIYSSVMTGYLEGIFGSGGIRTDSLGRKRLRIMNADIGRLYRTAASRLERELIFPNRMLTDDSVKQLIPDQRPDHYPDLQPYFYCYETMLPPIEDSLLSTYIIDDLNRFFFLTKGIRGDIVEQDVMCWVMSLPDGNRGSSIDPSEEESKTSFLDNSINYLNQPTSTIFSSIEQLFWKIDTPLINEMEVGKMSLSIPRATYTEESPSFQEVKDALVKHGINVKKEVRRIKMVKIGKVR